MDTLLLATPLPTFPMKTQSNAKLQLTKNLTAEEVGILLAATKCIHHLLQTT